MITVIIPALNEELALPATLQSLCAHSGDLQIIVVDGGSSDSTADIARQFPGVELMQAPQGRALQMNAGAAAARGDLLLFLHADTLLPSAALELLREHSGPEEVWGGFRHRFSGSARPLRIVSALHNWRCGITGVFYGDQAMFVSRSLFDRVGGFPAEPILEDILLSERLLEEQPSVQLPAEVVTDSRKFEQMGPWRSFWRCLLILASYELRLPIIGQRFFQPVR